MKKIMSIALFAVSFAAFGQSSSINNELAAYYVSDHFNAVAEKVTIVGTVALKGDVWVIQGAAGNGSQMQDYYPSNLGRDFKVDGMRVSVEATLDPIPAGVKLAGTPITIITIQKL